MKTNTTTQTKIKNNSTPVLSKRFAGAIIDICLLIMLSIAGIFILNKTPMSDASKKAREEIVTIQDETKVLTGYGEKVYEYDDDGAYKEYSDEVGTYIVKNITNLTEDIYNAYKSSLSNNENYKYAQFAFKANSYAIKAISISIVELLLFFVIPLCKKKNATIGMLFAKTQMIKTSTEDKPKWYQNLWSCIWLILIESLLPLLVLSEFFVIGIIAVINIVLMFLNTQERTVRNYISGTRMIDADTYIEKVENPAE